MLPFFIFLGLTFSVNFSFSRVPVTRSPSVNSSSSSIRSLFTVQSGEKIIWPELDVAGPKPRLKWVEAYERVQKLGLIPSIPKTKIVNYLPVYPSYYKGQVCNPGLNNCILSGAVHSAPAGKAGISFDDGPQPPSLVLLEFLKSKSQKATHFLIGSRILSNLSVFKALDLAGEHLACHTFSHPMMTSLTDHQILGELGWTMQVIHDLSINHVVPLYWRSPYGDLDERVIAIAKHVFGLETILWRSDSRDWCLADSKPDGSACLKGDGPQSLGELESQLVAFAKSPKKDGLLILEHEQSHRAIAGFKTVFSVIKRLNWITKTVPGVLNAPWYQ